MKAIDKIVFNELASRRAVVLPGLGTLGVTRRTAQVDGDKVKAPVNEVVFSKREATDAPTVVRLMETMGLPEDTARTAYREWYEDVLREDGFCITGVGTVAAGVFEPSTELGQMLNPARSRKSVKPAAAVAPVPVPEVAANHRTPPPTEKEKRGNCLTNILLAISIVLLLVILCFCFIRQGCTLRKSDKVESVDANATYDAARGASESEPAAQLNDAVPARAEAPSGNFYLIAGSFIYEANADELIARYRRDFPDLNVEKLITDSWVMVSVWRGDSKENGEDANRNLRQRLDNSGMWVYQKK